MRSRFIICVLLLPCCLSAQNRLETGHQLNDTARIDTLNARSYSYSLLSLRDSAMYYAETALLESQNLHYVHGIAVAFAQKAYIKEHFYNDFVGAERLEEGSLQWYSQTGNKTGLARLYCQLAFTWFCQGEYTRSLEMSQKAYEVYERDHDLQGTLDALDQKDVIYLKSGQFDKAFDVSIEVQQLAIRMRDPVQIKASQFSLGQLCMAIEDYPQALQYYKAGFASLTKEDSLEHSRNEYDVWAQMEFAEIYSHLGMFDSALNRYNAFDTAHAPDKDLRIFLVSKGEYFMLTGQYEKALPNLLRGVKMHLERNDRNEIMRTWLDIARTYKMLGQGKQAEKYARLGLDMSLHSNALEFIRDACRILFSVYEERGQSDSAYRYYRSYIEEKEAVTDNQARGKFAAYNYEKKIETLNSEKLIGQQKLKIREQQLRNESLLRNILIIFVLTGSVFAILLLRNARLRRRNEKLTHDNIRKELQHRTSEMEMQALRAQMNPHFIFNCLNSINRFIMKNESLAASDYLTQFSRLMRMVLNNSKRALIPLEEEMEMLRLYMDMEKLRFKDAFDYRILCSDDLEPYWISVPPLLLQPFVENAIWHGLMHKKENGMVTVSFTMEDDILLCEVVDNGIGRALAAKARSKSSQTHKSLGIQITRERLAHINGNMDNEKVSFRIEDLFDEQGQPAGTRVSLKIRYQQNNEVEKNSFLKTEES